MTLQSIGPATLRQWMRDGQAVVVDVREPAEYASQRIPGSLSLPLAAIARHRLPELQGRHLVIHCQKGGRGTSACQRLLQEDAQLPIYHLEGGLSAWTAAGLPTESAGRPILPLDRQVQLTIGLLILIGTVLSITLSPLFLWLIGAIGLGLTMAGLTGFCGLARLLARMPWNQ